MSRERLPWNNSVTVLVAVLNRPQGDALSFPAGKADQSRFSSPWSQGAHGNVGGPVKDGVKGGISGEMTVQNVL